MGPLDFRAEPGQVVALIGPNGAGKTTLMRVLTGLLRASSGTFLLAGRPVQSRWELARRVAYAPTEPAFPTGASVGDLLRLRAHAVDATGEGWSDTLDRFRSTVRIPLATRPRALSRGQRLRLSLELALLGDPAIILADEPWSGLDPLAVEYTLETLRARSTVGTTVVVSSHDLLQLPAISDRFVFLLDGLVRADGTLQQLRSLVPYADQEPGLVLKQLYRGLVEGTIA